MAMPVTLRPARATRRSRAVKPAFKCLPGVLLAVTLPAQGQVLLDGRLGTLPAAQGWSYAALPGLAQQSHTGDAVRLATTAANAEAAGYARVITPALDRHAGFNLAFRFRLPVERHARNDRAGFSVIVLDAGRRGIELGFWQDQVFAQADQPLFTRGEEASHRFDAGWVDAVLSLRAAHYTLFVNRAPLLTGPVRDYTAFNGFPDVYETANFVFLGDDTTSAAAEVELAAVALVRPVAVTLEPAGTLRWPGVPGQAYAVESSRDLLTWAPAGQAVSETDDFAWPAPAGWERAYFRVAHP
jgi:hypothetical protein